MALFNYFPFSNAHELNLDWILEVLSKFPRSVNNTLPDENGNINLPTVAGMSSWNGIGADGLGNVDPVEIVADLNQPVEGFHIYRWENPDTLNNPYGAAENTGYMLGAGGGLCWSCLTNTDYSTQLASNNGSSCIAIRTKNAGEAWSTWHYMDPAPKDVSSSITLGVPSCIDTFKSHSTSAIVQAGHASILIEGSLKVAAGDNDYIAGGLPIPYMPGIGIGYIMGIIQDAGTAEIRPCRVFVDHLGDLRFSYMGKGNINDVISIRGEYPVL